MKKDYDLDGKSRCSKACWFRHSLGLVAIVSTTALVAALIYLIVRTSGDRLRIDETGYWGPVKVGPDSRPPPDDERIYKRPIQFSGVMVSRLKEHLQRTAWVEPLQDAAYEYGVNLKTFRSVIDHWKNDFNLTSIEEQMNNFSHYETQIEGLKIHFFRSKPAITSEAADKINVYPLMLIHGWPGSFVEFQKIARLLSAPRDGVAFDVIVPSLPGHGYSQGSCKKGLNLLVTARIFSKLMSRLGYSRYFVQGGDWGAAVSSAMAALYPEVVRGIHVNMMQPPVNSAGAVWRLTLFALMPSFLSDNVEHGNPLPPCMPVPLKDYVIRTLRETGHMHLHSTKPDTVGLALLNSPVGLAAYIIEKFAAWTRDEYRFLDDGGLTQKFTLDELLSNVMVYYDSQSIVSSLRFYRENFASDVFELLFSRPITVPAGYAVFPNELSCIPRYLASGVFSNLTSMTYLKDGGHFAALETPELLEKDVRVFVTKVNSLYPETVSPVKDFDEAVHTEI